MSRSNMYRKAYQKLFIADFLHKEFGVRHDQMHKNMGVNLGNGAKYDNSDKYMQTIMLIGAIARPIGLSNYTLPLTLSHCEYKSPEFWYNFQMALPNSTRGTVPEGDIEQLLKDKEDPIETYHVDVDLFEKCKEAAQIIVEDHVAKFGEQPKPSHQIPLNLYLCCCCAYDLFQRTYYTGGSFGEVRSVMQQIGNKKTQKNLKLLANACDDLNPDEFFHRVVPYVSNFMQGLSEKSQLFTFPGVKFLAHWFTRAFGPMNTFDSIVDNLDNEEYIKIMFRRKDFISMYNLWELMCSQDPSYKRTKGSIMWIGLDHYYRYGKKTGYTKYLDYLNETDHPLIVDHTPQNAQGNPHTHFQFCKNTAQHFNLSRWRRPTGQWLHWISDSVLSTLGAWYDKLEEFRLGNYAYPPHLYHVFKRLPQEVESRLVNLVYIPHEGEGHYYLHWRHIVPTTFLERAPEFDQPYAPRLMTIEDKNKLLEILYT